MLAESLTAEAGWWQLVRSFCQAGCLAQLGFGVDPYNQKPPAADHSLFSNMLFFFPDNWTFFFYASSFPSPQVLCTRTLGCGHIWRQYLCRCNCPISRDLFRKGLKPFFGTRWGHRGTLGRDVMAEKEMSPQHKIPKSCWRPGMHQPQTAVRADLAAAPFCFRLLGSRTSG